MKRMKKIISILLAMAMVLGMGLTAFADESENKGYTITITNHELDNEEHIYQAYQIFAGELEKDPADESGTKEVLSNIQWGSGVKADELMVELKQKMPDIFGGIRTDSDEDVARAAAKVAEILADSSKFESNTDLEDEKAIDQFAKIVGNHLSETYAASEKGGNVITVPAVGYYIVKDDENLFNEEDGGAYTRFVLQVVGNVQVTAKAEVPSGTKEVFYQGKDAYENNGTYVPNENLKETNYATIGDNVAYQITSKVPNYTGYEYYYFIMNDTMSSGLSFNADSVSVKIVVYESDGKTVKETITPEKGTDYFVYTGKDAGDYTFKLAFKDIMEKNADGIQKYPIGATVIVNYSALVTEDAIIGVNGNENAWSLDYSRNPHSTGNGGKNPDNPKPGLPMEDEDTVLGQTPVKKTFTFLTELDITKYGVDSEMSKHLLAGAEFTLEGISNQVVLEKGTYYVKYDASNGEHQGKTLFYKLANGSYTDVSPDVATEVTYVKIGTGDAETTTGYLKGEDGNYYTPQDTKEYVGKTLYKRVEGKAAYADPDTQYVKIESEEIKLVPTPVSIKLTTDETGKIAFVGLGEGKYTLTETETPDGYNTIDPIEFTIEFTPPTDVENDPTCKWTIEGWKNQYGEDVDGKPEGSNGIFSTTINNMRGSLLPSTGGIGTTIFYVVGGILVIGAGILLVAKKRMSKN